MLRMLRGIMQIRVTFRNSVNCHLDQMNVGMKIHHNSKDKLIEKR